MKKQRITIGSILEIKIDDKYYVYAQILTEADCAFFDYKSEEKLTDLSLLERAHVLFIVAVYDDIITQNRWQKVGKLDLRPELKIKPMKFIQDPISNKYELYDPNNGDTIAAKKNECIGLERAAVWEAEHVEGRISDHYNNIPNIWVERFKAT